MPASSRCWQMSLANSSSSSTTTIRGRGSAHISKVGGVGLLLQLRRGLSKPCWRLSQKVGAERFLVIRAGRGSLLLMKVTLGLLQHACSASPAENLKKTLSLA